MGNRVSQNEHFVERTSRGNGLRSFYEVPLYMYSGQRKAGNEQLLRLITKLISHQYV